MSELKTINPNPPADFSPTLGDYKTLQPFRYWCQKVLPLVYDDSLSYYELLCKVVDYLNKTMEDVETLHGDVSNLHTAYIELQNYVNNYFSTLDVQQEINNKLDNMAKDGTLSGIIKPLITSVSQPSFVDEISQMTDTTKIYVLKTNGEIYYYNGVSFVSSGIKYSLPSNLIIGGTVQSSIKSEPYNDLNTFPNNSYTYYVNGVNVSNVPTDYVKDNPFSILSFNASVDSTQVAGASQVFIEIPTGKIWTRSAWSDGFNDWKYSSDIYRTTIQSSETPVAPYDDLDTFPNNRFTFYVANSTVKNLPSDFNVNHPFFVFTLNPSINLDSVIGVTMFLVDYSTGKLWTRARWSESWSAWYNTGVNTDYDFLVHSVLKPFNLTGKIAFFGDSITVGYTSGTTTTENNYVNLLMQRVNNTDYNNYAIAGSAFTSDYNEVMSIVNKIKSTDLSEYDTIIIAGGTNDCQLNVPLSAFNSAINELKEYLNTLSKNILFITPINSRRKGDNNLMEYSKIIGQMCYEQGYNCIIGTRLGFSEKDDYSTIMIPDGVHPSEKGYRLYFRSLTTILL